MKKLMLEIFQFKWIATYITSANIGFAIGYAFIGDHLQSWTSVICAVFTGVIALIEWRRK